LFVVPSPASLSIDVDLFVGRDINRSIRPATAEEIRAAAAATSQELPYYGSESFPIPARDGTTFELYIRYTKGKRTNQMHSYNGDKEPYDEPVFVAYNLFSLAADKVSYDAQSHILEAQGHVHVQDEGGKRDSELMKFKIEAGKVLQL
jgi:lipopolysaccharide assembly outer membrane protein LptD (OstA)